MEKDQPVDSELNEEEGSWDSLVFTEGHLGMESWMARKPNLAKVSKSAKVSSISKLCMTWTIYPLLVKKSLRPSLHNMSASDAADIEEERLCTT